MELYMQLDSMINSNCYDYIANSFVNGKSSEAQAINAGYPQISMKSKLPELDS